MELLQSGNLESLKSVKETLNCDGANNGNYQKPTTVFDFPKLEQHQN
jgi:hypothetical protein